MIGHVGIFLNKIKSQRLAKMETSQMRKEPAVCTIVYVGSLPYHVYKLVAMAKGCRLQSPLLARPKKGKEKEHPRANSTLINFAGRTKMWEISLLFRLQKRLL